MTNLRRLPRISLPAKFAVMLASVASVMFGCAGPAGAATPPRPSSAARFYILGAGDGHGIGMSQYGALGYALHGFGYRQILAHYYSGTTLATISSEQPVTVLLRDGSAGFSGAGRAGGMTLDPATTYTVRAAGSELQLFDGSRRLGRFRAPLRVTGRGPLTVPGLGPYDGSLLLSPDGSGGVQTVEEVGLDDYVEGVVAAEMPAGWPAAALEAQAVAARTYAIASGAVSAGFELYSDTRSQMYGGVDAETPQTDAAVAATAGQIVEYDGLPAVTYFFASSGGYTEDIQNVWPGATPEPWLRGVPDPYDDSGGNPYYRWQLEMPLSTAAARLRGYVRGSFEGIRVLQHGVSPRVIAAEVLGSGGDTTISGAQLQMLFGTISTYMSFETITTSGGTESSGDRRARSGRRKSGGRKSSSGHRPRGGSRSSSGGAGSSPSGGSASSGGGSASGGGGLSTYQPMLARVRERAGRQRTYIEGTIVPARPGGAVVVEAFDGSGWRVVGHGRVGERGGYAVVVRGAGRYRISYDGLEGPPVTLP